MKFFLQNSKIYLPARRIYCALLLAALLGVNAAAQTGDGDEVISVDTALVRLNVGVNDRNGKPVTDLTRDDFVVFEDGTPQTLLSFEPTAAPFSLVMLLDTSGSTLGFRQQLKFAARRFLDALAPGDRVAVVSFNNKTDLLTNFTTDRRKNTRAIEAANGRNATRLFAALEYATGLLGKEGMRRKAIVVLTDGVDSELRGEDRRAIGDAETEASIFTSIKAQKSDSLRRVLDEAARQGITVYPLILPSGDPARIAAPTPIQIAMHRAARERVEILATQTGGRLHLIDRLEDMGRLYAEVAADLRTLYSLSYQPEAVKTRRADGWREIRIEAKRSDLIVRTRPGYFGK